MRHDDVLINIILFLENLEGCISYNLMYICLLNNYILLFKNLQWSKWLKSHCKKFCYFYLGILPIFRSVPDADCMTIKSSGCNTLKTINNTVSPIEPIKSLFLQLEEEQECTKMGEEDIPYSPLECLGYDNVFAIT